MAEVKLSVADRRSVWWRHQFLQGSWNYERMQNGGWCYAMIPAIKALYKDKEEQAAALKRHLEFYNTQPYVSAPIIGVTLALEEERANGAAVEDQTIQGVKVGMMGPLAGVGDPVFWFTVRPILGALGASMAMGGSIVGPLLFFIAWNLIRMAFLWYTPSLVCSSSVLWCNAGCLFPSPPSFLGSSRLLAPILTGPTCLLVPRALRKHCRSTTPLALPPLIPSRSPRFRTT